MPHDSTIVTRFWSKVARPAPESCWEWQACAKPTGYGLFRYKIAFRQYIMVRAHRFAWELTHGPIPDGLSILHRCDNPRCVNPAHLFLGTQQENITDMVQKGRLGPAKLTAAQVADIRSRLAVGKRGTARALAHEYGITETTVSEIRSGKTWTA